MQAANRDTILGELTGAPLYHLGVATTFSWRGDRPVVRAEGPDGALREFDVKFTFGVDPLQQYLVPFPDGRLQALSWAWDARPREAGGQRWIDLHPNERIPPGDPLHWTSVAGNWNHTCAECHSTQVKKGYDAESERYDTTYAALNVGCEACHGPGSAHVAWAKGDRRASSSDTDRGLVFRLGAGDGAVWSRAPRDRIAHRSVPRTSETELETCARCHSRRAQIDEDYVYGKPILDTHRVALLDEGLYYDDGQIQDEVFEYGSFLQSRMHARGVTCSDCHDPHSLKLRADGNALCGRCHAPAVYDTRAHHHHVAGTPGAQCVSCHAPTRVYMQIDARHDHSFRVPRPDLSDTLGTPNACSGCHTERSPRWAADAVARWRGRGKLPPAHFGSAIHAGRSGAIDAEPALTALVLDTTQPAIARATALRLLRDRLSPRSRPALEHGLTSEDPLLRLAAAEVAEVLPPPERLELVKPLLQDPVRTVRIEAAFVLASVPTGLLSPEDRTLLGSGLKEFRAAQRISLDQPEAHMNLGNLHAALGGEAAAREEYEAAIRRAPWAIPAYVNLADVLRAEGHDTEGEALLREALARAPDDPQVLHALGLLLVREKRMEEAVVTLGLAAARAPELARYAVAYALALQSTGEEARATTVLEDAHARRPGDREPLVVLLALARDRGDEDAVRRYEAALREIAPDDPLLGGSRSSPDAS